MYTTAGGKRSARTSIVARTNIPAGRNTLASVGIAVTTNASVAGKAIMSVLVGDGGEVVAMSGHTLAATSESVDGINGAGRNGSADGAGHVGGSDPVPPGQCVGGRNLVKISGNVTQILKSLLLP
jgi:hypothetical protein